MAITSSDIDNQSFSVSKKGYSIEEVDVFLETVSREVGLLNDKVDSLEKEKSNASESVSDEKVAELNATIARQNGEIERLKKEVAEKTNDGKAISEALIVAQRSAEKIVAEANDKSKKIIKDANDKADYIEKDADNQKKKVLAEIDKLEKEQAATRKEYQVMLRDIITSMDKRLTDSENFGATKSPAGTGKVKNAGATSKNKVVAANNPSKTSDIKPVEVNPEPQKDFSGFGDADFGEEDKID